LQVAFPFPLMLWIVLCRKFVVVCTIVFWEREQVSPCKKIKSAKKPCNTGIFGTLQNLKKA